MLANRVRMRFLDTEPRPEDIADENCRVATDEDFSGTTNGSFKYIGTATSLVIPHIIKGVPVTSYANMFNRSTTLIREVRTNNPRVTNMDSMFANCSSLTSLDLSSFDTSNVTSMGRMFQNCGSLTSLDLSIFDTSNVTSMGRMLQGCTSLTSLDLSIFDTSNVIDMSLMFDGCTSLTSLDLSSFDTSNVIVMDQMFENCTSLTSLDLSSFDTSNVIVMDQMFQNCGSITTAYARTQEDADKLNTSSNKPSNVIFIVKGV